MSELTNSAEEATFESYDDLASGTKLLHGQYTIEQFLNAGGFGVTYLAKDSLDRTVVIKECFPSSVCRRSATLVHARSRAFGRELDSIIKLFVGEARTLSRLNHPNIVGVHQVFEENGTAYMALDYVEGNDLITVIEEDELSVTPKQLQKMLVRLLSAAHTIHGVGILHRDISPDNILIDNEYRPVLIDFGAARESAVRKSRMLSAMRVVKDGYSPYEFYVADSKQGPYSDLYSLGATFYHVISGVIPPESQARLGAIASGTEDPCVPLVGRFPQYDPVFLASIDKAMSVLPQDRPQTAREWKEILDGARKVDQIDGVAAVMPAAAEVTSEEETPEIDETTATITELVALQRNKPEEDQPEADTQAEALDPAPESETAEDPLALEPEVTVGDVAEVVPEAAEASQAVRPTRPVSKKIASRVETAEVEAAEVELAENDGTENLHEGDTTRMFVPPVAASGGARTRAFAGTGVGVLALAGVLAFALSSNGSEDATEQVVENTPAVTAPAAAAEETTVATVETVVPEAQQEAATLPVETVETPAPTLELVPATDAAETTAAPVAEETELASTTTTPQVLSVTPVPVEETAEPAGADAAVSLSSVDFTSGWTVRLPTGISANPGTAQETVFAVNGVDVKSEEDLMAALSQTVDLATEREVTVDVLVGTSSDAATSQSLTLPVVHRIGARDGMRIETSFADGNWSTVVAELPPGNQSDLQVGDQLIALISSEEHLDTGTALADALASEAANGKDGVEVALVRGGTMWAGYIALEDF